MMGGEVDGQEEHPRHLLPAMSSARTATTATTTTRPTTPPPPFVFHANLQPAPPLPLSYPRPVPTTTTTGSPLPPMAAAQQHGGAQSAATPFPLMHGGPLPPYALPPQYGYANGAGGVPIMPSQQVGVASVRYPLPPQPGLDARQMSGGRHKKEIKRRTKTGCLTCRKRRIKCDEGQPSCRNCQKSKRECLGYDPIFKQTPSPANLQPAPLGVNAPTDTTTTTAAHAPYDHLPPATATFASPPHPSEPQFDYHPSLDPALTGATHSPQMQHSRHAPLHAQRRVPAIVIDDLFSPTGSRPQLDPNLKATHQDVEQFYKYHYAPGLDRFFETDWYSVWGIARLKHDADLHNFVAQVIEQFKIKSDDATGVAILALEADLVWRLTTMPRGASLGDFSELLPRIDTIEKLLTGQFLPVDQMPPPPPLDPSPTPAARDKYIERSFWRHLAQFVALRDDRADPAVQHGVADELATLRGILGMLENRDVLYSMAVARHLGGRMPDFHPPRHLVAASNDPDDPANKVKVAHQFVEAEAQRGMTQVIQRMCSMALRSWTLAKQSAVE